MNGKRETSAAKRARWSARPLPVWTFIDMVLKALLPDRAEQARCSGWREADVRSVDLESMERNICVIIFGHEQERWRWIIE